MVERERGGERKEYVSVVKDGPASFKQPMYILQPTNALDIDNLRKITIRSDSVQEAEAKARGEGKGQTLTLMEDGSLGMMEVACWNET